MKQLLYIVIIAISLTGCQKCKDKNKQSEPSYSFAEQPDLYAYAYFKPGTYWVYQDSISGILDSVYVTFANKGSYTNGDAEVAKGLYRGTFSWFTCYMTSSYDHYQYNNWMDQSYEVHGSPPTVNRERYIMPSSGNKNGETIHTAIISIGKQLTSYPDYVYYKNHYSSFQVKGVFFNQVQKWLNKQSMIDNKQDTYYYIAKNIGIVRREQVDSNRTWNLIRYHIIQ